MCFIFNRIKWKDFVSSRIRMLLRHYATSWKVMGSNPDEVDILNLPIPSSCTVVLGSLILVIEMSTRNILGGKGPPAHKADNLTASCQPIV
jgi:hypothetical protein